MQATGLHGLFWRVRWLYMTESDRHLAPAGATWLERLRQRVSAGEIAPADLTASGLINAQIWMERAPWRPAALWAGMAGLLAAGVPFAVIDWQALVLALLLADPLWGSVWRLAGGRDVLLPLAPRVLRQQVRLPYLESGSPAARLFSEDHTDLWPLAFRVGAPAVLLVFVVAAVLGIGALLLTLIVALVTILGWTARHTLAGIPVVLFSVVAIGLPWMLVLREVPPAESAIAWAPQIALATLWVVHHWGETRVLADGGDLVGLVLLAVAEAALCVFLVVMQAPLWLGLIVLLLLPMWLAVFRGQGVGHMSPFWLLAMLLSALALGQVV